MNPAPAWKWCEFTIKGSNGNLLNWHLVERVGNGYRGKCGRLLASTPERTSDQKPNQLRGVCRMCTRLISR
jgi:hypothetical protein